jgi:proline racemase
MSRYPSLTALEVHAGGEPGRVIVHGAPDVPGASMLEKMQRLRRDWDHLRLRMLREPRGYPGLCCNVLLPPTRPEADAGFVIMEQSEYPAMSGSNTICVTTVLIETGLVPVREPVTRLVLEAPAGLIAVEAEVRDGRCVSVSFDNVPAFCAHLDAVVQVPELGEVVVDVAWGGMWYVIADADALGVALQPDHAATIARTGQLLRAAAAEQLPVSHPDHPELGGISIAQLSGRARDAGVSRRNAVVITTGELDWERPETWRGVLDRSPCGTGTCAKMAVLHARGELALGEDFRHQGILDTVWTGRLIAETRVGDRPAVVPRITGRGWIYGRTEYLADPQDPFPGGFTVADIWARGER